MYAEISYQVSAFNFGKCQAGSLIGYRKEEGGYMKERKRRPDLLKKLGMVSLALLVTFSSVDHSVFAVYHPLRSDDCILLLYDEADIGAWREKLLCPLTCEGR